MQEDINIDELLNSFIDDELTQRQQTEIRRLIAHDPQIKRRLRQLQKCKMLVGSLPHAEAPADLAEQVKASLERKTLLEQQPSGFDQRKGARHLLVRKVLAAAAMIGLVAILSAIVYTIVAPETAPPVMAFSGRLELKTNNFSAADAFINKAIQDNGLLGDSTPSRRGDKTVYSLTCSRERLNSLLTDLNSIWERFDSAALFVETKVPGEQVVVADVTAEQIVDLIIPTKPRVLGQHEETIEESTGQPQGEKRVHLTIVLIGGE